VEIREVFIYEKAILVNIKTSKDY